MDYAALAGAGASAIGNLFGAASQIAATGMNHAAQFELSKREYYMNQAAIDRQNEYNSPKSQIQRYLEAGLNPNLIYGEGKASAGQQQGIAQYHKPDLAPFDFSGFNNILGDALNVVMQKAQIEGQRRENDIKKEQELYMRSQRMMQEMRNLEESTVLGVDPGLVWIKGERELAEKGLKMQRYRAELEGIQELNKLRSTQEVLNQLNTREKQYVYENLLPLQTKVEQLKAEGIETDNAIKSVQRQVEENLSKVGASSGAAKLFEHKEEHE